ncbi:unnamed protein product [Caenorhabditis sp. 36 PRJEB53466]|nr:unnamed protein product [Caenorhabditis sp. 36 PRJEB53466]
MWLVFLVFIVSCTSAQLLSTSSTSTSSPSSTSSSVLKCGTPSPEPIGNVSMRPRTKLVLNAPFDVPFKGKLSIHNESPNNTIYWKLSINRTNRNKRISIYHKSNGVWSTVKSAHWILKPGGHESLIVGFDGFDFDPKMLSYADRLDLFWMNLPERVGNLSEWIQNECEYEKWEHRRKSIKIVYNP